jgi:hypothetical protein
MKEKARLSDDLLSLDLQTGVGRKLAAKIKRISSPLFLSSDEVRVNYRYSLERRVSLGKMVGQDF